MKLLDAWASGTAYTTGDLVYVNNRVYEAQDPAGTSGASSLTHTSGTASDGTVSWKYIRTRTDGNLKQDGWASITGGSGYANGTYTNVPLTTNGDGLTAKATIVVAGNAVASVTITEFGYGYDIGDTISADDVNLGNSGGSSFSITLTQVQRESQCITSAAHQLKAGDLISISGITPTAYNKVNYIVVRTETLNRFTVCLLYTSPSPRDVEESRMPSSA